MNAMRLLVYAVVASALVFLVINIFQIFFPSQDYAKEIELMLDAAEVDLGKYVAREILLPANVKINAGDFDTASRSVVFICNNPAICCTQGKSCPKIIEWDNVFMKRYVLAKQAKKVKIAARCRFEELYICKIYIGSEPAQIMLEGASLSADRIELAKQSSVKINYVVKNIGRHIMVAVPKAKIYVKNILASAEKWVLLKEVKGERFSLQPNEALNNSLELNFDRPGAYRIEFTLFEENDETNYVEDEFKLRVSGSVEITSGTSQ
ncbi:MAG: hypothetical protein J7L44_00585 [Candidatus Diapherotrites archaeon]|nr:hypothetical protein [Candidatus Diapherotrites archaeon]